MKTPITKPMQQGKGSVIRFMNDEMDAIIEGLAGADEELITGLRQRFEAARLENARESEAYERNRRVAHEMSPIRLGMRGWHLASKPSDRLELYLRTGDFLPDGQGWQYGVSGAFDGEEGVLVGATQGCLFSRKDRRWMYTSERPVAYDEAAGDGTAALAARRKGFPRDEGINVRYASISGVVGRVEVSRYGVRDLRHRAEGGEVIGRLYGDEVRVVHGRAVVMAVVGFFETLQNHRWHPTYDAWVLPDPSAHDRAERTGPFWCASAPVWTLRVGDQPDSRMLKQGLPYEPTSRDEAVFKVFATRDEAVAYAAGLEVETWGHGRRPMFGITADVPDVTPSAVPTPSDEMAGEDVFAQAA